MSKVAQHDICRKRGDTHPLRLKLSENKDSTLNIPLDVRNFTFVLTVTSEFEPVDNTAQLFQLAGTIDDGLEGSVIFPVSPAQSDQTPDVYFYDIQMTDSGGFVRTVLEGKWTVEQDRTK